MTIADFLDDLKKKFNLDFSNNAVARMLKDGAWQGVEGTITDIFSELLSLIPGVGPLKKAFGYINKAGLKLGDFKVGESEQPILEGFNRITDGIVALKDRALGAAKEEFEKATAGIAEKNRLDVSDTSPTGSPAPTPTAAAGAPAVRK